MGLFFQFSFFLFSHFYFWIDRNFALCKYLISKGSNLQSKDGAGWTPLHVACNLPNIEIANFLIKSGAGVMTISSSGSIPLHYLSRRIPKKGQEDSFFKLILNMMENGASINAQNNYGETPLHG